MPMFITPDEHDRDRAALRALAAPEPEPTTQERLDAALALLAAQRAVLDALTPVLDNLTGWEVPQRFSCTEADDVARLFAAAGREDDAALFIRWHADDDDEGDTHGTVVEAAGDRATAEGDRRALAAAHDYVKALS